MKLLANYLKQLDINNSEEVLEKLMLFFTDLLIINKTMNLTRIIEKEEAEQKHFIDSLSVVPYLTGTILDIGAGAGFPSIPLAICKPDISFTLVDSVGKKVDFLQKICASLELKNTFVLKSRAEDLSKTKQYETVLARGLGPLNIICEYCLPFVKINGLFIAYKAQKAEEELIAAQNALKILGGKLEKRVPYQLIVNDEIHARELLLIRKIKETDPKYPRGGNKARLSPL